MNLELVTSSAFNGVTCDFYHEDNDQRDLWLTRNQIGAALGYKDPDSSLSRIHERHKSRLDRYCAVDKLAGTDGKLYDTYIYNRRGVMEICRWSRQPKADEFMDWVYDVVESYLDGEDNRATTSLTVDGNTSQIGLHEAASTSPRVPLSREELAAYMLYEEQHVDNIEKTTVAFMNSQTEIMKEFINSTAKTQQDFCSSVLTALTNLSDTVSTLAAGAVAKNETVDEPKVPAENPEVNTADISAWKSAAWDKVNAIAARNDVGQKIVFTQIYTDMRHENPEFCVVKTSPGRSLFSVVANDPDFRTTFDNVITRYLNPPKSQSTASEQVQDPDPAEKKKTENVPFSILIRMTPECIWDAVSPLYQLDKYNKNNVLVNVFAEMDRVGNISLRDEAVEYARSIKYAKVSQSYMISQRDDLMELLNKTVSIMLERG